MTDPTATHAVDQAIESRRSLRAFLPTPVPRETVERILDVAARAPSGTNMQPWRVHVLGGATRAALSAEIEAAHLSGEPGPEQEYPYYPERFFEPYLGRRRKVGWDLYNLLGITRDQTEKMRHQHARNFAFFDAPVGMIFTIDRRLAIGSWLDYGMFLQNIMIAARARGLDTCPQAAFAGYHAIIRRHLALDAGDMVICGMSLGHADPDAIENSLVTERVPAGAFATFWDL
ncbi:MAG TPA: nitroreductase [Stellaceae bacterium]|nr:nitroreductase [Stellaceae bacterium]